jgi:hypothetical protein
MKGGTHEQGRRGCSQAPYGSYCCRPTPWTGRWSPSLGLWTGPAIHAQLGDDLLADGFVLAVALGSLGNDELVADPLVDLKLPDEIIVAPEVTVQAKLPERLRVDSGTREARLARLHRLVSQVAEQCQARDPKAPEGLDQHWYEGQGGGHLPIRKPLGGVPGSGRKPGGACSTPSEGCSRRVNDGKVTHHEPAREHEHDIPSGPGSEGRVDTQRVRAADGSCHYK